MAIAIVLLAGCVAPETTPDYAAAPDPPAPDEPARFAIPWHEEAPLQGTPICTPISCSFVVPPPDGLVLNEGTLLAASFDLSWDDPLADSVGLHWELRCIQRGTQCPGPTVVVEGTAPLHLEANDLAWPDGIQVEHHVRAATPLDQVPSPSDRPVVIDGTFTVQRSTS